MVMMAKNAGRIGGFGALVALGLWAAGASAATPAPSTIRIDNFSFQPATITVPAGTHLVFENHDDLPHTVVIPDLQQKSKMLDTDDKYETVLDKPGKYVFFCGIHPMMKGEITVTAP
jgi:plastocyanin